MSQADVVDSSPFPNVTGRSAVSADVASVQCNQGSTDVCVAELKLLGRFSNVEGPGDLTVSGEVVLDFGGESIRTRRLGSSAAGMVINLDNTEIKVLKEEFFFLLVRFDCWDDIGSLLNLQRTSYDTIASTACFLNI